MPLKRYLGSQLFKNISWNVGGTLVSKLVTPIISVVVARLLSPEIFGLYGLAFAFIGVLDFLRDFGLRDAIIQNNEYKDSELARIQFTFQLVLFSILYPVVFLSAPYIASFYDITELKPVLRTLSLSFFCYVVIDPYLTYFLKKQNYQLIFYRQLIPTIGRGLAVLFLILFFDMEIYALVYGFLFAQLMLAVFVYFTCSENLLRPYFKISIFKELFSLGKHVLYQRFLTNVIFSRTDTFILAYTHNEKTLGLYKMANNLASFMPRQIITQIHQVIYTELSAKKKIDKIQRVYNSIGFYFPLFLTVLSIVGYFLSPSLIPFLLGSKWIDAVPYFQIFIATLPLISIRQLHHALAKIFGYIKLTNIVSTITAITYVLIFVFCIQFSISLTLKSLLFLGPIRTFIYLLILEKKSDILNKKVHYLLLAFITLWLIYVCFDLNFNS